MLSIDTLARDPRYAAFELRDTRFQRAARVLQSMWRESRGYPKGSRKARDGSIIAMGSRLEHAFARASFANFLNDDIREIVRRTVANRTDELIDEDRLLDNLLSSQPLCFNLFAPLKQDLGLATRVLTDMTDIAGLTVDRIEFEYSPGRSNSAFSGDRSAFDVCAWCTTPRHARFLVAIETKYHESMVCIPRADHASHQRISRADGCVNEQRFADLAKSPLEQIWRDHVLAMSMHQQNLCDGCLSVVAYPAQNEPCRRAVDGYKDCLTAHATFAGWHLQDIHAAVARHSTAPWVREFHERYLDFTKVGFST